MADTDITLAIIMDHLRGMETRLSERISGVEGRMTGLEGRMTSLENKVEWMYRNLTGQLDAIDKRLDAVEIEFLPKRVSRIEKHLSLTV